MRKPLIILLFTILFTSCEEPDPVKQVDVSDQNIPFQSHRMDHDIFGADYNQPAAVRQQLYQKYGSFYCDYLELVLQIGPCDSIPTTADLRDFVGFPDMKQLQVDIDKVFTKERIAEMDLQFEDALKRWNYFFPDSITPQVVYMNSGFNYSAYSTDSILAVGLDYYLGTNNSIVKNLAPQYFPQYLKDDMRPDYAMANGVKNFAWSKFENTDKSNKEPDLLTMLIHHGKMMYLADALMPEVEDSIKLNWTSEQMKWAEENEMLIWKELAKQDIMFRTDFNKNNRWFAFGPFTNAENIPQDSPPQLGLWMGWNFVKAYMKENPKTTILDLMKLTEYQTMLKSYRPSV